MFFPKCFWLSFFKVLSQFAAEIMTMEWLLIIIQIIENTWRQIYILSNQISECHLIPIWQKKVPVNQSPVGVKVVIQDMGDFTVSFSANDA